MQDRYNPDINTAPTPGEEGREERTRGDYRGDRIGVIGGEGNGSNAVINNGNKNAINAVNNNGIKRGENADFINGRTILKGFSDCTTVEEQEELRKQRSDAGKASGEARREKALIRASVIERLGGTATQYAKRLEDISLYGKDKDAIKAIELTAKLSGDLIEKVEQTTTVRSVTNWHTLPPSAEDNAEDDNGTQDGEDNGANAEA